MKTSLAAFMVIFATAAAAQNGGRIDLRTDDLVGVNKVLERGGTIRISKHGDCRIIENMTTLPVFVPTRTPQEWSQGESAFLNNLPRGVIARDCP
jgi:hypothetical protein